MGGREVTRPAGAFVVGFAVFIALGILALGVARRDGEKGFYQSSDPKFFRAVAHEPFGDGRVIDTPAEAPYRYGRIGLPLVAWVAAAGHPEATGWTLVIVNLLAIAAVPTLAGLYLASYGRDPRLGALAMLAPGLLLVYDRPYAEPLAIALVLGAFVAHRRRRFGVAFMLLAFAICVRETAVLAVVPFVWHEWSERGAVALRWALAVLPYAVWSVWVRVRVGSFPFLAHVRTRSDAVRAPAVGWVQTFRHGADARLAVVVAAATVVLALLVGWRARAILAGSGALAATVLPLCLGPNALLYLGETLRILAFPQVLTLVAVGYVLGRSNQTLGTIRGEPAVGGG